MENVGKKTYEAFIRGNHEKIPEEDIILKWIEQLNGTDTKKEGLYYLIIIALYLTRKPYVKDDERLKLARLVNTLYNQENKGLVIRGKSSMSLHEIDKKQIIDIRKVMIKQLTETFTHIALESWEYGESLSTFWENRNPLTWDFENDKIVVSANIDYTEKEYTLDKNGINDIIIDEMNRPKEGLFTRHEDYKVRALDCINRYAKQFGYFRDLKTIGTDEACFLYDTFNLLGLIQEDPTAKNDDKKEFIKKELRKGKVKA